MIAVMVFVIVGAWYLLIGLGTARVSKNPEASDAWLNKRGIVFRIGGPIMAVRVGSWGGQRPSLVDYVTVTGPRPGRPPSEGVRVAYPL